MKDFLDIIFSGDLVLDEPNPGYWLGGIAPALNNADLVVGHLEVPHTRRGKKLKGDVPAPGADPDHLAALPESGFNALTLAGNHMADCGEEGITDTREGLRRLDVACCGAGKNLEEARRPAILSISGKLISILSYNCVGPENGWAAEKKAGVAFVRIETSDGGPVTPSASLESASSESVYEMRQDIASAKQNSDIVLQSLYCVISNPDWHRPPPGPAGMNAGHLY